MKYFTVVVLLALLMLGAPCAHSQTEEEIASAFTDMMYNGRVFYINNENIAKYGEQYAYGCIDTLFYLNPGQMALIYPKGTRRDITAQLKDYYKNNPDKRARPIIEVLMTGCRASSQ